MTAGILLTVRAPGSGTYTLNTTAASLTSAAQASAIAELTVIFTNQPPIVNAGVRSAQIVDSVDPNFVFAPALKPAL